MTEEVGDEDEMVTYPYEPWMVHNICGEVGGDLWFPDDGRAHSSNYTKARAICMRCPVVEECAAYALRHGIIHGMWGGLSPMQRRALRAVGKDVAL